MQKIFSLQILVTLFIVYVSGSHFRGGTISWKYLGEDNMVEFKFRLAWALGSAGMSSWVAVPRNGGLSLQVGSFVYNQTANSTLENWEQGEGTFIYNVPSNDSYRVSFTNGDWITLAYGYGGSWNIETTVDLHNRSDTQKPNYSPITTSRAIYRVQFGCPVSIQIPMVDTDGDTVKCRWATPSEASSIYKLLPNSVLDENKCIITFTADAANNYSSNGWYAVAITIEDFPRKSIIINGEVYTPTTPITQIPLQFLIRTETISATCDEIPKFVVSSPPGGSVKVLKAASTLNVGFYVESNVSLSYIDINGPLGLTKTSIKPDDQGRPNIWFVNVSWTPQKADKGTNIICATAEDINRKLSETLCFTVLAWEVNPCDSFPCYNNGTCDRVGFTQDYICACGLGFTGRYCDTNIDECVSNPCRHGATCTDHVNGYTCSCIQGYTGTNCEIDIDECISNLCQHGATCTDHVDGYTCSCIQGYTGTLCEIDVNECTSYQCQHGGQCIDLVNIYKCYCIDGYTGSNCQTDIDECISSPCQNDGTCTDRVDGYTCNCVYGYTGFHCETDVDECNSNPCFNNGTCVDSISSWTCQCQPGFNGVQCQMDVDECMSSPCLHNGTCINLINSYRCQCANSLIGENCQTSLTYCHSSPCLNGGQCHNQYGGYTCDCPDQWHGYNCEYKTVNRTDLCKNLEYTECSCVTSKLREVTRTSYKELSGLIGLVFGLLGTVVTYIVWRLLGFEGKRQHRIHPVHLEDSTSENSIETTLNNLSNTRKYETTVEPQGPIHCDCFVDHTGNDHFQRYEASDNRFRFHNCRHKNINRKLNYTVKTKLKTAS